MSAVRFTRRYRAAPAEVWAALTEPESITRWLDPSARLDGRLGGGFAVGRSIQGEVTRFEPERLLEVRWQTTDEPPSVVRFELSPTDAGTVLVLDHSRLDEIVCMAYARDWTRSLARLGTAVDRR